MKKLNILFLLVFTNFLCAHAQTLYYQAYEIVNNNGIKSKGHGGLWITFQHDKSICYESNENGYGTNPNLPPFKYTRTQEGTHIYEMREPSYKMPYTGVEMGNQLINTMYFSNDFSQMVRPNKFIDGVGGRIFYRRTDGPYDDNVPIF